MNNQIHPLNQEQFVWYSTYKDILLELARQPSSYSIDDRIEYAVRIADKSLSEFKKTFQI